MMEWQAKDLAEMKSVGHVLAGLLSAKKVVVFDGEMGAGKTTLIRFICEKLGVTDEVSSPTFSLVNEYLVEGQRPVFHFDLYRLETPEEGLDFGIEEYFDSGSLCLIEWAENLGPYLPEELSVVKIRDIEGLRRIDFQP
ncbi:MAG: tRNA (adenosine(37)-N6)-threonylcarbamoyltransferase complex ATPase subunit type 1 TsaE [Flavobacteriales bacterium]|nr:tRNA (adenosine(37)-N6)-threonylcarbamoyltransferase complex ATPase subunit type 1 TsaE [Flavobacteriales bacterium]MDG2246419.1 tRNA (adenosine(37)-N6)-threonylcarbamoyltransferase complex ATPase subunit type 1 TsaE [Flavobacteriales bacterium]